MDMDDIEAQLAALHGLDPAPEEEPPSRAPPPQHTNNGFDVSDLDAGAIFGEDSPIKEPSPQKEASPKKEPSSNVRKKITSSKKTPASSAAPSSKIVLKLNVGEKKRKEKSPKKSGVEPHTSTHGSTNAKSPGKRRRSPSERETIRSPEYLRHNFTVSCGLDRQKKAARAGFANAADEVNRKDQWKCCFCQRGTHFAGLGDLFGPYVVPKKHRSRSGRADLAPGHDIWFHHPCAYWAPGIYIPPTQGLEMPNGLLEFLEDSLSKLCVSCGEAGASVACVAKQCDRAYHLPCAYAADCDLNDDNLQLLCRNHKSDDGDIASRNSGSLPSFLDGSVWKMRY